MLFRIRIDSDTIVRDTAIQNWVKSYGHVLVRHILPGMRNRHYHIFLDAPFNSEQSCRYNVTKMSGAKGTERSVKECDPTRQDEYIQYLFNRKHGNAWRLVSSTIDTTEHQAKALQVAETFEAENAESTKRKANAGPTAWELSEETKKLATARIEEDRVAPDYINKIYVEAAIDVHHKYRKPFCEFSLMRVVTTALSGTPSGKAAIMGRILTKLNSN